MKENIELKQEAFLAMVRSIQTRTEMNVFDSTVFVTRYLGLSVDDIKKYMPIGLKKELYKFIPSNHIKKENNFIVRNFR